MRIEGSLARTTATAFLIVAALSARETRAQSGWIDGGYWANGQYYIDGVFDGGGQVVLSGWGCARGVAQSIWVHFYAGGPAGSGQWVGAGPANEASEWAVLQACGVGYGAYRYNIAVPFGPEVMMGLGGLKVYVHGISPIGGGGRALRKPPAVFPPPAPATPHPRRRYGPPPRGA